MKEDIRELIEETLEGDESFSDAWELYEKLDYNGSVHQLIDGSIDIYYIDIRKWAVDNWQWVEEAIGEGICEGVTDYHKLIQSGQYVSLRNDANEYIKELFEELDGVAFNVEELDEPEAQPEAQPEAPQKFTEILLEGAERDAYIAKRFGGVAS